MNNSNSYIHVNTNNGVKTIEFFHPSQNSLPSQLLKELAESITNADNDSDISIIVIKSAGIRSFCAGASFNELASLQDEKSATQFFMGFANVINAIRKSTKIVIGRIQGKAVGGGVGIAAACDVTFATSFADARLSELIVGIGPFVIGPVVERKIGKPAFVYQSLTPEKWINAKDCLQLGLYQSVHDSIEEMDLKLEEFITNLSSKSRPALLKLKNVFWEGTEDWDELLSHRASISGKLVLTVEAKKAITSFLQK